MELTGTYKKNPQVLNKPMGSENGDRRCQHVANAAIRWRNLAARPRCGGAGRRGTPARPQAHAQTRELGQN